MGALLPRGAGACPRAPRRAASGGEARRVKPMATTNAAALTEIKAPPRCASIVPAMDSPRLYPSSELVIDPVLIRRHDVAGPRYTSYPTADRFVEAFGEAALTQWLARRNVGGIRQPLSLYVHLPFCENVCY